MADRSRDVEKLMPILRLTLLGVLVYSQFAASAPAMLSGRVRYLSQGLTFAAFGVLALLTAVSAVWVLRRRPPPRALVVLGVPVALVASAASTAAVPPDQYFTTLDWSFGLVGWHLLLLLIDRTALLLAALGAHVVISAVQHAVAGIPDRALLGTGAIVMISATSLQVAVVLGARALQRGERQSGEVAAERDRLETQRALAKQRTSEHRLRFAEQLGATLPLLTAMADGTADPRDADVRREVAHTAAQLRRLFAENDDVPDPLVHELSACIDVAERRGITVSLAISGATTPVPTEARRGLTEPVIAALSSIESSTEGKARVSVLRTAAEVRVAVVTDGMNQPESERIAGPGLPGVEVTWYAHGQHARMEARWRVRR